MVDFGFTTGTTGFSSTIHDAIQKAVVATLRAGLIALPKGTVVPANLYAQKGENFTLRCTEYPDLEDSTVTNPLTEGVPPSPLKLGVSTLDFTVAQVGAWTSVTDIAAFQSPHDLNSIAVDKIARLAAVTIDTLALEAELDHGVDDVTGSIRTTEIILDAKAQLQNLNVQPVNGYYYCLCHPFALRGLEGETGINGYVNVSALSDGNTDLSKGVVSEYRGVRFITSSRIPIVGGPSSGAYPAIFMGANSIAFGDVSTLQYFRTSAPDSANPLAQFTTASFKGILGGAILDFADQTDGAGNNGASAPRIWTASVLDGLT